MEGDEGMRLPEKVELELPVQWEGRSQSIEIDFHKGG